jgi:hypothetical protein
MRDSFDTMSSLIKVFFVIVITVIILSLLFRVNMVLDIKKNGKTIYQISVNKFNEVETYMTGEYTRDEKSGCISFKDEFGIKRIVCNNYTITEY